MMNTVSRFSAVQFRSAVPTKQTIQQAKEELVNKLKQLADQGNTLAEELSTGCTILRELQYKKNPVTESISFQIDKSRDVDQAIKLLESLGMTNSSKFVYQGYDVRIKAMDILDQLHHN